MSDHVFVINGFIKNLKNIDISIGFLLPFLGTCHSEGARRKAGHAHQGWFNGQTKRQSYG